MELKRPIKENDDRIVFNKCPTISTKQKRRAKVVPQRSSISFLWKESLSKGAVDMNERFIVGAATLVYIYIYMYIYSYILFHVIVDFTFCKMDVSTNHASARSLPQNWRM